MNFNIEKIKSVTVIAVISIAVAAFLPGISFIFIFKPTFFETQDLTKIVFLGCSMAAPIWFLNSFVFSFIPKLPSEGEIRSEIFGIVGSSMTVIAFYIPILLKRFVNISSNTGILIVLGVDLLIIFSLVIHERLTEREVLKKE